MRRPYVEVNYAYYGDGGDWQEKQLLLGGIVPILTTPSGKTFRFEECPGGEIIVYPSDDRSNHQEKTALVITPYTINLVATTIMERGRVLMGASRDNPPKNSLGQLLKEQNQSTQQLSYLSAILQSRGFCSIEKEGNAFILVYRVQS
jgi:hypothetical protein